MVITELEKLAKKFRKRKALNGLEVLTGERKNAIDFSLGAAIGPIFVVVTDQITIRKDDAYGRTHTLATFKLSESVKAVDATVKALIEEFTPQK